MNKSRDPHNWQCMVSLEKIRKNKKLYTFGTMYKAQAFADKLAQQDGKTYILEIDDSLKYFNIVEM